MPSEYVKVNTPVLPAFCMYVLSMKIGPESPIQLVLFVFECIHDLYAEYLSLVRTIYEGCVSFIIKCIVKRLKWQ